MKIRMGFITNSSSTNFLIISNEELTEDFLFRKLGFVKGGKLEEKGMELCKDILYGISRGLRYYDYEIPTYERIKEVHIYWGNTGSDSYPLTQFFTTDSFEIEEKDFYINGRSCVW